MMVFLLRGHAFARLSINHASAPWSQIWQHRWTQPLPLVVNRLSSFTIYSYAVSTQDFVPVTRMPGFQPLIWREEARNLPIAWLYSSVVYARKFSSLPSSAQASRPNQSQRSGGRPPAPRGFPPPPRERHVIRRTPAVATYRAPITSCQLPLQPTPPLKEQISPHAKSARLAVYCIICISITVCFAWSLCLMQQVCIHEGCTDNKCGHEVCPQVQWMVDNMLNAPFNIRAGRYWTLVTASFSHLTPDLLFTNMIGLAIFASPFYTAGGVGIGAYHIMGLAVGSAVFSNSASLIYKWNHEPTLPNAEACDGPVQWAGHGASGVLCAFVAAATCFTPLSRIAIGRFTIPIRMCWVAAAFIYCDLMALESDDNIGHDVHLAGFVFGLVYYLVALRKPYGWW